MAENKMTFEELREVLKEKIEKHKTKCAAHEESLVILKDQLNEFAEEGLDEKVDSYFQKVVSTERNIEYHQGSYKTYQKVLNMIQ